MPAIIGRLGRAFLLPRIAMSLGLFVLLASAAMSLGAVADWSPWLRVLLALICFMLPGGFIFALVPARRDWDLIDFAGYGFAFSLALMTGLGLLTRTLALSIDAVELIWLLLALLGFCAVGWRLRGLERPRLSVHAPTMILLAIVLVQVAVYAHGSIFAAASPKDQYRNQAAINGFLRDEPLGWQEPYYETGNLIADRMALTYWVLAQALAAELSGVPILLARYMINPFVMLMSVAALYIFARNLRHGRASALVCLSLGLLAFSLLADVDTQAGTRFFVRAQLDKVVAAFALAPIAISSACLCANSRDWRAWLAFALVLFATCSVHSIIGGFAVCVIALYCLIQFIMEAEQRRNIALLGLLSLAILGPAILLRLGASETTIYSFGSVDEGEPKRIIVYDAANPLNQGEKLYAISPLAAGALTYLLLPIVFITVAGRRLDARSRLMLAFVIAAAIGIVPITAWIYGRLVSVNHVLRILWLLPYGYMLAYVAETGWTLLRKSYPPAGRWAGRVGADRMLVVLAGLSCALCLYQLSINPRMDLSRDIASAASGNRELLEIAEYIDSRHDDRVWVAASDKHRERILALHWKVISLSRYSPERMAYYSNLSLEQAIAQTEANIRLYDSGAPVEQRLAIIERYRIDYLLYTPEFARAVDHLYQTDKRRFEQVYTGDTLRLVRVHPAANG